MMPAPSSSSASCVRPLTVAAVPTGMKTGVSITPCGVVKSPAARAGRIGLQNFKRKIHLSSVSGEDERESHAHDNVDQEDAKDDDERLCALQLFGINRGKADGQQQQLPDFKQVDVLAQAPAAICWQSSGNRIGEICGHGIFQVERADGFQERDTVTKRTRANDRRRNKGVTRQWRERS